jgi:CRP-like cAMP-binding protein
VVSCVSPATHFAVVMKMVDFIDIITDCSLFTNYKKSDIQKFLLGAEYKIGHYGKNEFIFRMDQPINYIGIILKGSVEMQKIFQSGKVLNLIYKEQGELFAEGAIFSSIPTYPCQVISREKTEILLIPKQQLILALYSDKILLANFLSLLSDKLVMLNRKIELLAYCSIQSKIAFSLLHCVSTDKNANIIELPYTKKTWAEHLNVSRPSLCRELTNLCRANVIQMDNRTITILERSKIEKMLNE